MLQTLLDFSYFNGLKHYQMSEYPKEIEGIVVNNAQEEEIAKEELA